MILFRRSQWKRAEQFIHLPIAIGKRIEPHAHLVAFDNERSGFAHLHPKEIDLSQPPDSLHPQLNFKVTIPRAGRYVVWAQVNLAGQELFVPFWIEVLA